MRLTTTPAPHIHGGNRVARVMQRVLLALVPGVAAMVAVLGWGIVLNMAVAVAVAVVCEMALLRLRRRPVALFLNDWSAVVMAVLLALCLPPLLPAWMTAVGVAFGLVFGKHLYGGLGYNPFNPAMVGYVALLVAFPQAMVQWPAMTGLGEGVVGPLQAVRGVFTGDWPGGLDAITQATPLDRIRTGLGEQRTLGELRGGPAFGAVAARGWEWVNAGFLVGGLALVALRVVRWQIPTGVLLGLALPALVFWGLNPDQYPAPLFHVLSGGAMLGAFFVATDPVSAATTPRGRLVFGLGVGLLAWVIRTWGGYPDGIAFGVLLMNMAVPLIDRVTQPRVYGHRGGGA